ncbi:hypothetical protein [Alicyclobacillus ferrooxydans]|uniref:Uncharacterized protein n=1 Tax=Alicyclobacillus ferrooxydans TaxID=471514 RepID=A0A0P9GSH0_9BACL|nr:hypothetical protein [Alicyclobacillus ferrooxydans]KPV43990.1 hypothetical protein AN477_09765 [Alicyclobacillus ferrooxydans]
MIPISEFLGELECSAEQLAGQKQIDSLARDVVLLNHQDQIWLTREKTDEFDGALVFVQSRMFPGYLSTFDLLLRFLKQAGAVGVLFQGGKRTDFSKATVMLAENLGLPLIWIRDPVKYSTMARQFYGLLLAQQQQKQADIHRARRGLEAILSDAHTLHTWLTHVADVLDSKVTLRPSDSAVFHPIWRSKRKFAPSHGYLSPPGERTYPSSRGDRGDDTLVVPMKILEKRYELCIMPSSTCRFYEPDIRQVWIDELAGILVAQASYLFLLETPGIALEHQWVTSFESLVYYSMANMPIFKAANGTGGNQSLSGDVFLPDVVGSISLRRHLDFISLSQVSSISVLWLASARSSGRQSPSGQAELGMDISLTLTRPYTYRLFRDETLALRHHALELLRHARFSSGMQYDLLSCVPWRNWKAKEGVVVVWIPFAKSASYLSERVVHDFVRQLSARLPFPLRAFFHRGDVTESVSGAEELLRHVTNVLETSYPEFLSQQDLSQGLQFSQTGRDIPGQASIITSSFSTESIKALQHIRFEFVAIAVSAFLPD